ncbi:hypothetical protein KIN20_030182 [Parelaphostrongylus tenuis]|uniref:Uncharacterized protein n=1 Tax=Parelaphostrongylus tenuis TaxID=148309 RepID=A0AAD5WG48_PARTN|nr:hypothetical protein KIN20_030182 [Parelaphostrongylus tenuis]
MIVAWNQIRTLWRVFKNGPTSIAQPLFCQFAVEACVVLLQNDSNSIGQTSPRQPDEASRPPVERDDDTSSASE